MKVQDRLAILEKQGPISSDDELRYHLFALSQKFVDLQVHFSHDTVKQLVTIDPLIATAWVQGKAFSCELWGQEHGFVHTQSLPVATVFKIGSHWVPVSMHPVGNALHVFVWDADGSNHLKLNEVIECLGLAMGFVSVFIQRDKRTFISSDLCGTLAIAYLHNLLLHVQLPSNQEETMHRFHVYRGEFLKSLSTCDITRRPWAWAKRDTTQPGAASSLSDTVQLPITLSRDQRLDQLVEHRNAVGDDEIRFHINRIISRYYEIQAEQGQTPTNHFVFFEPLVYTCWESIGRTISARWTERNQDVRLQGKQILTAFLLENHWFPFWTTPHGDCLTFHTVAHEVAAAHKFKDVCACIGQQLGFPLFALHIAPSNLPAHDLCGAAAMMFLAHVVHGAVLPDTVDHLLTIHTNMRAAFVEDLYTRSEVPAPVIWGNGCVPGESGLLPIMPGLSKHAACVDDVSEDGAAEMSLATEGLSLGANNFDWPGISKLVQRHFPVIPVPTASEHLCTDPVPVEHLRTRAMDVAEMVFHLSRLTAGHDDLLHGTVPFVSIVQGLREVNESIRLFVAGNCKAMVLAVLHDYHWSVIVCVRHAQFVRVFLPSDSCIAGGVPLSDPRLIVQEVSEPSTGNLCGAHVVSVVASILGLNLCGTCHEELECLQKQLKLDFLCGGAHLRLTGNVGFGLQGSLLKELAAVLTQHGVPVHLSEDRANDAIRVIGSEQLLTAMQHRQPWRQLKTLGNQKKFKFVLPSELSKVVESKSGSVGGKGKGKSNGKFHVPMELDPCKLQIVDGVFRAADKIIPQIHVKQIGPVSSGVIMMTLAEADPYLRSAKCVSTEPLALVVLHQPDAHINTALPHAQVTVPCRCTVDKEPVLADATLVQIGTGLVEKHKGHDLVELDTLDVVTVKFLVYRDEIPCSWEEFCKAPIRFLVTHFPLLRRCFEQGCQCDQWHNSENLGVKEPILDVWRRQFLRAGFKPAPMDKAEIFSVCLRVPSQILVGLLAASGTAGAYGEPRTADGTEILTEYTVVWSPKMSAQELMHLRQTNPAIIGLARVGERKGLRVHTSQASGIHQLIRPDTVYLPQGQKSLFLVGPFPFGIDRAAISKAMRQAQWECRPLQPSAPLPGKGSMWIVQAVDAPVHTIIATSHGEVVITRHKPDPVGKPVVTAPVASAASLALCGAQPNRQCADNDPWSTKDPRGGFKPSTPVTHAGTNESMMQLETRVQNAVLAKLPAQSMEDDMPDRMSLLEGQVQQLMVKQQGLEGHFSEFSAQQSQQMTAMQVQINNHGQQLHGHMENQNQVIQSMFAQQMDQIRGLLSKRPREEFE